MKPIRISRRVLWLVMVAPWCAAAAEQGGGVATEPAAAVQQQLQSLQEQVRALQQRISEIQAAAAPAAPAVPAAGPGAQNAALVTRFGPDGFTLQSADGANVLRLRGNLSMDGRFFGDRYTPTTADTWLLRRVRPTFEGTLAGRFDFRLMPDFAQGKAIIQDAWIDARIAPWLVVTAGKFKAPVGLERLQLEQFARFIEVALPADLLPYRDLGLDVGGAFGGGVLSYALGLFDGVADGASTDGNATPDTNVTGKFTWEGRLFAKPFLHTGWPAVRGLGFGLAGTYVNDRGSYTSASATLLPMYKTPGQQALFSYRADTVAGGVFNNAVLAQGLERRLAPQLSYYCGPFGLLGEFVKVTQQVGRPISATGTRVATLEHSAWQLQASLFLTGEPEAYDAATPRREFQAGHGGAGAWELVARVHAIQFDEAAFAGGANSFANPLTAVRAAHALGAGVNWYLNRNVKVQLDYEVTHFDGGASTGDRHAERVLTSQVALIY